MFLSRKGGWMVCSLLENKRTKDRDEKRDREFASACKMKEQQNMANVCWEGECAFVTNIIE